MVSGFRGLEVLFHICEGLRENTEEIRLVFVHVNDFHTVHGGEY